MGAQAPGGFGVTPKGYFSTGEIFEVRVHSNPCATGSRAMGTVYIKTRAASLPPVTLQICFMGNEKVAWPYNVGRGYEFEQDSCGIVNISMNVLRTGKPLEPNRYYQFDFAFDLPPQIPGSFFFKYLEFAGQVLIATLIRDNNETEAVAFTKLNVVNQQPVPQIVSPYSSDNTNIQAISSACFCQCIGGNGTVRIAL